jgi:putative phosphoribosyl transferase
MNSRSTGMFKENKSKVKILSYIGQPFLDRQEAGTLLAKELIDLKGQKPVVLGIPRGGVVIAQVIARRIDADLDIVLARKLGTPGQLELAMGSVAEDGEMFLNRNVVDMIGVPDYEIQQ